MESILILILLLIYLKSLTLVKIGHRKKMNLVLCSQEHKLIKFSFSKLLAAAKHIFDLNRNCNIFKNNIDLSLLKNVFLYSFIF